jgi:uncharacterized protein
VAAIQADSFGRGLAQNLSIDSHLPGHVAIVRDHRRSAGLSSFSTRRKFLQLGVAGAAASALAIAGDGTFFEANRPRIVPIEVHLPRLAASWDGVRIAQLSDLHYDDYFSVVPLRKAIDMVTKVQPDLIVVTGDFVTARGRESHVVDARAVKSASRTIEPCAQLVAQLHAPLGVFSVLGNHDLDSNAGYIVEVLQSHAVPVLRNQSVPLERDGKRLWISGVDDILNGKPRLERALKGIPPDETVVLLAHEPDWADHVAKYPVDLQLSGHSHGGQIRFPLVGAPYLPPLGRRYPWGQRQLGRLALYTNIGLGTIGIPMRFGCPPEVTLITLRSGPAESHP